MGIDTNRAELTQNLARWWRSSQRRSDSGSTSTNGYFSPLHIQTAVEEKIAAVVISIVAQTIHDVVAGKNDRSNVVGSSDRATVDILEPYCVALGTSRQADR